MWESSTKVKSRRSEIGGFFMPNQGFNMVPKAGLEPARPLRRGILNPLRLPFRHLGLAFRYPKVRGEVQSEKRIDAMCCDVPVVDHSIAAWFSPEA